MNPTTTTTSSIDELRRERQYDVIADERHTVSYVAHLTGALMGCLVGLAVLKTRSDGASIHQLQRVSNLVCLILFTATLVYVLFVKTLGGFTETLSY